MKIINKVNNGFTNDSFIIEENNKKYFKQIKRNDSFNHLINYEVLNQFDFVPKLCKADDKHLIWEFIDHEPFEFKEDEIREVARNLKKIAYFKDWIPKE